MRLPPWHASGPGCASGAAHYERDAAGAPLAAAASCSLQYFLWPLISASSFAISFFAFLFRGSRHASQKFARPGLMKVHFEHGQVGTGAGDAAVDVVDKKDAAGGM